MEVGAVLRLVTRRSGIFSCRRRWSIIITTSCLLSSWMVACRVRVAEDNLEAANAEQTYVCDPQTIQNTTEDGEAEEDGPYMEADQGEEDERILE